MPGLNPIVFIVYWEKRKCSKGQKMKAVVYERYGGPEVLEIRDIEKPTPNDDEILIKIHATTVTAGDIHMRIPSPFLVRTMNGLFKPKKVQILGFELAGVVEAVGSKVERFKPGDEVFAFTGFGFGAYTQYKCMKGPNERSKASWIEYKPKNIGFDEAAAAPVGGVTALALLRMGNIHRGQKVLIYGASGSVGTYAVQLAKYYGAEVTGVCSTANLDLVRSLGADHVFDYTREDFTSTGPIYDLVIDAVGKMKSKQRKKILKKEGSFHSVMENVKAEPDGLLFMKERIEAGDVRVIIDRRYTLDQIVEAHQYVQKGHKKGNVVVLINHEPGE